MSLKKRIESELNIPVRLRTGGPGSLDVFANGEQIFSLKRSGRMPVEEEIVNVLRTKR